MLLKLKKMVEKLKIQKYESLIFLFISVAVTSIYAIMVSNQTMPFAEGWYTYYAECINSGMIPYRDFEYLFSPVYIYIIAFFTKIFGYKIIFLRAFGVFIYAIITIGLFLIVKEIVGENRAWVACVASVTAAFYLQSEVVQVFYDYVRVMDIFSVFTTLFLIKTVKKMFNNEKYTKELLLTGLFNAIFLNIKQNMGILFLVYVVVLLIYLGFYRKNKLKNILKDLFYFILPILICTFIIGLLLLLTGSLKTYINSTGAGAASAKGGMYAILFNWIINGKMFFESSFITAKWVILFIIVCIVLKLFFLKDVYVENTKNKRRLIGIVYVIAIIVMLLALRGNEDYANKILPEAFFSPYTVFVACFPFFVFGGIVGIVDCVKKKQYLNQFILYFVLAGSYFAISYGCGTSGGLAEGQSSLGIIFLISILLHNLDYKLGSIFQVMVMITCLSLTVHSVDRKLVYTYNWWGADEANFWESNTESDIPLLKGIKLSKETKYVYESIYKNITEYTSKDDSIVCFPQISIFYSLCERKDPGMYTKVQWFDVSTEESVLSDIHILKENMPKAVLIYNVYDSVYASHERSFNKGNVSATRIMKETLFNMVYEYNYTMMGTYKCGNNSLSLWIKLDDNYEKQELFAGGSGTLESPYQIEDEKQLLLFSKMVNDGRTFEGQYIEQTSDIDLSEVENWIPIGIYDSGNYFMGTYNGKGHIIKNINISDNDNVGLFGMLAGKVYNLGLESGKVKGHCCGAVASHSVGENAEIINCYSQIDVTGYRAGGIADNFYGKIKNVYSSGKLQGAYSANIISYNGGTEIENAFVFSDKIECDFYTGTLYRPEITYCNKTDASLNTIMNMLNWYVEQNSEEIPLVAWKQDKHGNIVFSGQ